MTRLEVLGVELRFQDRGKTSYICITDIAKKFNNVPSDIIKAWMRNRNTVEFLGVWETLNNPDFNLVEFDQIKTRTGLNSFILTAKEWVNKTQAVGIESRAGRYGGTWAHWDIALEFASYVNPTFKLYIIQEFQRLKTSEAAQLKQAWNIKREISKANYFILTETIRDYLIPPKDTPSSKKALVFSSEADMLNEVVFGMTAKQWKAVNPNAKGNMRDNATVLELTVLANVEVLNSRLILWDCTQEERYRILLEAANDFKNVLQDSKAILRLSHKAGE